MIGDRLRGFFGDMKNKFISVGETIKGIPAHVGRTVGDIIQSVPGGIEEAREFLVRQAVEISKGGGQVVKNIVSGGGEGLGVVVDNTFGKSVFTGPVMLGGLGLAALLAFKVL